MPWDTVTSKHKWVKGCKDAGKLQDKNDDGSRGKSGVWDKWWGTVTNWNAPSTQVIFSLHYSYPTKCIYRSNLACGPLNFMICSRILKPKQFFSKQSSLTNTDSAVQRIISWKKLLGILYIENQLALVKTEYF